MTMNIKELYEKVRDGKIISDISLQREIVYDVDKQRLVIDSIVNDIPLPAFYFWKNESGILEVLDGKQRIFAIRQFIENNIEYAGKLWKITPHEVQDKINATALSVIVCEGTEELKREIFRRINTLGVPLSRYEVLNGLYNGEYLHGLSTYVEQDKGARKVLGANGRGKNQFIVLMLLQRLKGCTSIDAYVKEHQGTSFTDYQHEIGKYIRFVGDVFDRYNELSIRFGLAMKYYNNFALWKENRDEINLHIARFLHSDDAKLLDKASEIEDIVLATVGHVQVDDKRLFTLDDKRVLLHTSIVKDRKYPCAICGKYFAAEELQVDHVEPWSKGGRTVLSNAQLLCGACNRQKGNKR